MSKISKQLLICFLPHLSRFQFGNQRLPTCSVFHAFPVFKLKPEVCPFLSCVQLLYPVFSCIFVTLHLFEIGVKFMSTEGGLVFCSKLRSQNISKLTIENGVFDPYWKKVCWVWYFICVSLSYAQFITKAFITLLVNIPLQYPMKTPVNILT